MAQEAVSARLGNILWLQRGHFCAVAGFDPNRDPNAEKSRWIQADTVDRPPSRKHAKAPESVAAQRFPALIVSSHAGGHWFESSSLHQKVPDFVRNQELFLFMNFGLCAMCPQRRSEISFRSRSRCCHSQNWTSRKLPSRCGVSPTTCKSLDRERVTNTMVKLGANLCRSDAGGAV